MNKLLIILAFFCLKVDGQVLNIFPEEPVSTWHPGSVLNVFGNYVQHPLYQSGNFDFITNKWDDADGSDTYAPSLINSYCIDLNGTTNYITISASWVSNIDSFEILARAQGGEWIIYTPSTDPVGLYSSATGVIYIGKNGTSFFDGSIAYAKFYNDGELLNNIPFSQGYGKCIYYDDIQGNYGNLQTSLNSNIDSLGNFLDVNANGVADNFGRSYLGTGGTINNTIETGGDFWVGKYQRTVMSDKGGYTAFYFTQSTTVPTGACGGYAKLRYRTDMSGSNIFSMIVGSPINSYYIFPDIISDEGVHEIELYWHVSGLSHIYLHFTTANIENGQFFEWDMLQTRPLLTGIAILKDTTGAWIKDCDVFHNNLQNGFDFYYNGNLKYQMITHKNDTCLKLPDVLNEPYMTSFTYKKSISAGDFNGAETQLIFPEITKLIEADDSEILFTDGVANEIILDDLKQDNGYFFWNENYILNTFKKSYFDLKIYNNPASKTILKSLTYDFNLNRNPILIEKIGNIFFARNYYNDIYDILLSFEDQQIENLYTKINRVYLIPKWALTSTYASNGLYIHASYNNDCPIATIPEGYIAGPHGFQVAREVEGSHGKTVADIGSIFLDGASKRWLLYNINGDSLMFVPEYNPVSQSYPQDIISDLTYVSGGVNTDNVTVTNEDYLYIFPVVVIDSEFAETDLSDSVSTTPVYCKYFDVYYKYRLKNFRTIFNHSDEIEILDSLDDFATFEVKYRVNYDGNIEITSNIEFHTTPLLIYHGFIQSAKLNTSVIGYGNMLKYAPGIDTFTINTTLYNLQIPQIFNLPDEFYVDTSRYNSLIERNVDFLCTTSDTTPIFADAYGFIDCINFDRDTMLNNIWHYWTSSKSYPMALDSKAIQNINYGVKAYYSYFPANRNDNSSNVYFIKNDNDYYAFIDYHTNVTGELVVFPRYLLGKDIMIVEKSASMTIAENYITWAGIHVTVTGEYGYAILKLN